MPAPSKESLTIYVENKSRSKWRSFMPNSKARDGFKFVPALLRSESAESFAALVQELEQSVEPQNPIERIQVQSVAYSTWDISRYLRAKAGIINNSFLRALENVLRPMLLGSQHIVLADRSARALAHHSLLDSSAKDVVSALLEEAGVGWQEVEAEALRLHLSEIEKLDRMIARKEKGRDKVLRNIARYKKSFASNLRNSSDRLLKTVDVPSIASSEGEGL
jgi:hypothetical protein